MTMSARGLQSIAIAFALLALGACSRSQNEPHPADHAERKPPEPQVSQGPHTEHPAAAPASTPTGGIPGMAEVEIPLERRQITGVRTVVLARQALASRIRTVGVVAADERRIRHVHTKVSGWIEQLSVSFTGQQVRAGEPILSIYSPELLAAQREYLIARRATLTSLEPGSTDERQMRSLLDSSRTRLRLWDFGKSQIEQLERTGEARRTVTLHSPAAGFVTLKPVYAGMYVTPEMELYTIADLSSLWIWADLYEDEMSLVEPGQEAAITLASAPGKALPAVVSYVSPALEPSTRTLRVRFDVQNARGLLRPGMFATVELKLEVGEVVALPEDALIDTGERKVVFVQVGEGRFQPREVTLGRRAAGQYEVLAGVAAGDRVVVSAQFLLDSESRLRAASGGPAHGSH